MSRVSRDLDSQSIGSEISHPIQPTSQSKSKDVKSEASCETVAEF